MKLILLVLLIAGCAGNQQEWPGSYTLNNGIVQCDSEARVIHDAFGSVIRCDWECKEALFGYEGPLDARQLARVDEYNTCIGK